MTVAHIWTGRDTACRMWLTGGLKGKYKEYDELPEDTRVCDPCERLLKSKRHRQYKNRYLDDLECPYCGFQPVDVKNSVAYGCAWQIFRCPGCDRKFMVDPKYMAFIFVSGNPVIVEHPDHVRS